MNYKKCFSIFSTLCYCALFRYDFVYGSVHIVMMSTEHDFRSSSKQYSDLANMLAGVNRSITPWLIFSGHRWVAVSPKI